jgi:hypothetical protein
LVDNNLFVECDPAVRVDGRGLDRTPVWRDMVDDYMRKRLNEVPQALYRQRYPAMATLDEVYGAPGQPPLTGKDFPGAAPTGNRIRRNVCVGKWLEAGWNAAPGGLQLEGNLTDAAESLTAPLGDHPTARDFVLKAESPAWAAGFRRIPVEQIGPRVVAAGAGASADSKRRGEKAFR